MYTDLLLTADDNGIYDVSIASNGDFDLTESFDTAILMALFTDKRATSSEVDIPQYRRGWFGNAYNDDAYEIGSKLWLLDQSRLNQETINLIKTYATEALQWIIDDGYANDIKIKVTKNTETGVEMEITFYIGNDKIEKKNFVLWENFS